MRALLKAFVRISSGGQVVPGSLIFRRSKPRSGRFIQIDANICCNPTDNPNFTPPAPTGFVVNDAANTGDWTFAAGYPLVTDYEYTLDGGVTYTAATVKPLAGLTGARAIGTVGVRVEKKGLNQPSATLYNATAYTP